jgi:hypothetical protein
MHWIFEKLILKGAMSQNLIIFEIKKYASEPKTILTRFEEKNRQFQPLLLLGNVAPL